MTETQQILYDKASEYDSAEEFKDGDLPSYLLASKHRILNKVFPPIKAHQIDRGGIFFLYKDNRIFYIGTTQYNVKLAVENYIENSIHSFDKYRLFSPYSKADTAVLYTYFVQKYKPQYNTNVIGDTLTITISETDELLGTITKGKL